MSSLPVPIVLPKPPQELVESVARLIRDLRSPEDPEAVRSVVQYATNYRTYTQHLGQKLAAIVQEVESSVQDQQALTQYVQAFLTYEQQRRSGLAPLLLRIRMRPGILITIGSGPAAAQWQQGIHALNIAILHELEMLRDARLRIELKKAKVLNGGQGGGLIARNGIEVRIHFRRLRDDAAASS